LGAGSHQRLRPQLSFRQRFSRQSQYEVMAPLVAQIYAHRQTIEIGAKLKLVLQFAADSMEDFDASYRLRTGRWRNWTTLRRSTATTLVPADSTFSF
jgi:hypothetical protein